MIIGDILFNPHGHRPYNRVGMLVGVGSAFADFALDFFRLCRAYEGAVVYIVYRFQFFLRCPFFGAVKNVEMAQSSGTRCDNRVTVLRSKQTRHSKLLACVT